MLKAAPLFETAPQKPQTDTISGTSEEYSAYSDASHEYYQSRGQKYNLRPRRRQAPMPSAKTPKKLSREIYAKNISSTFPSPGLKI